MHSLDAYRAAFLSYLEEHEITKEPKQLYEPVNYILQLGGKRMRPILALMGCELFGVDFKKALPAAMAVEVFHNFSLVHDDIMDDAPLRRGKTTVHEKWDVNTGILSGDAMLINAYQHLAQYDGDTLKKLLVLFNTTALEVCEGQQYDVDFEVRDDVTLQEYLQMIAYKTSVLVAAALQMGAIVAEATVEDQEAIYAFGKNLGIAFQLQDDYLDAFGDPETFGKQVGGDIIENKKTFLYITAMEKAKEADQTTLQHLFSIQPADPTSKITAVKQIFEHSGAVAAILEEVEKYTQLAFNQLKALNVPENRKDALLAFGKSLMTRKV
ncbi:polyprenyl synthetase family protein [Croceivirga sp. JEA036]|uniref:polyprenyl synthetase family protein n=1 Tax=Croceivirga sp. JEA036 TaxID=2721162 RepID=UPI00143AB3E5|nr:polyprenyl synthetase family protein [Croceivirga sp. JEA036]NJB36548.1 polyprenyl synthetase family protein [Croceivirga sp. JEA036]